MRSEGTLLGARRNLGAIITPLQYHRVYWPMPAVPRRCPGARHRVSTVLRCSSTQSSPRGNITGCSVDPSRLRRGVPRPAVEYRGARPLRTLTKSSQRLPPWMCSACPLDILSLFAHRCQHTFIVSRGCYLLPLRSNQPCLAKLQLAR